MKIAHRTADPKKILAIGISVSKQSDHLLVTSADGGQRKIEYTAFANLTADDVSIAEYNSTPPSPFKADTSHTWDGTAPVVLWTPPAPPAKEPAPITDQALFLKAMVTALGVAKVNDILLKYPIIIIALTTAKVMEWDQGNVKALLALAKTNGDLTNQNVADIRAAWVALSAK